MMTRSRASKSFRGNSCCPTPPAWVCANARMRPAAERSERVLERGRWNPAEQKEQDRRSFLLCTVVACLSKREERSRLATPGASRRLLGGSSCQLAQRFWTHLRHRRRRSWRFFTG